jgi:hypothetical protein
MVDSEKNVSKKSNGGGAGGDPLVEYRLACIHPGGPPVAELRGERGTWRLGRYVSTVQVWPAVFRRFDISSYQITRELRVTATYQRVYQHDITL